jgi:RNA polymerase sigma-70 factor (ECF subfamily)
MKTASLDDLLQLLCSGDAAAAETAFREYEPYLRAVVRRLLPQRLRPKFDSVDIVQSAWSDLLTGFRDAGWQFADANQLRAFLVKVTRNRFIDRYRQHQRMARREEPLAGHLLEQKPAPAHHTPSGEALAEDLWQRLLALCPPDYLPILHMKRQGAPLDDIAVRTGLHPGSIRRILRNLASRIAGEH